MAWYDVFSGFYDASLEPHYREQRVLAVDALQLRAGHSVLDLPCGTGQSFGPLVERVGQAGTLVGVDLSPGMVRQARRRVTRSGLPNVTVVEGSATTVTAAELGRAAFDRIHVFLGMTVFDDPAAATAHLWSLLAPGGRMVVVDVHNPTPGLQGRMVQRIAQADITRRWWEPLEHLARGFSLTELPSKPLHGGGIWMAAGEKGQLRE